MKIGIIAAVQDEIKTLHEDICFDKDREVTHAERQYYLGNHLGIELVLVYSRVGKVAASITATVLIEKFQVDLIVFTGLAGAVSKKLNRGDIIICEKSYQHDFDGRPLCNHQFEIPLTNRIFFDTPLPQLNLAKMAVKNFINNFNKYVSQDDLKKLKIIKPDVYVGTIATGDQFIQDIENQKNLFINQAETLAVEMEGAAVAQVCAEYKHPYILIRIISDKANDSAHNSLQDFSVKAASHYASGIIQETLLLLQQ